MCQGERFVLSWLLSRISWVCEAKSAFSGDSYCNFFQHVLFILLYVRQVIALGCFFLSLHISLTSARILDIHDFYALLLLLFPLTCLLLFIHRMFGYLLKPVSIDNIISSHVPVSSSTTFSFRQTHFPTNFLWASFLCCLFLRANSYS